MVSGSHFIRRDELGAVMVDPRTNPGFVLSRVAYSTGTPLHTIENTSADDMVVISVEHKPLVGRA